mmetsp:Transcript_23324/g.34548  ORF Transcript_23324/g.34548 Transcript_23324/m.34548 type:complete len:251 (+) Transcript_23324:801-1553(+)
MGTAFIEPKYGSSSRITSSRYCKFHPISDGFVFCLAHAPDIALVDCVLKVNLSRMFVLYHDNSLGSNFKRLVVRSVFLCLARHKPNVCNISHSCNIELSMSLGIIDHLLVYGSIASIRDQTLCVFELVILVPHLTTVTDNDRHGSINDNIRWNVQIGNALVGIHHCKPRVAFIARFEISPDSRCLFSGQLSLQRIVNRCKSIVWIRTNGLQKITMFFKCITVIRLYAVSKHNRVRNFHHGGLEVQTQHNI